MPPESLLTGAVPPPVIWDTGRRVIDLSRRPCIMGILNVTPDSFSGGSIYGDVARAVDLALEMEAQGADIIDIGGESTRPDALPVSTEEELGRVVPVVERLAGRLRVPLSIDTTKAVVAEAGNRELKLSEPEGFYPCAPWLGRWPKEKPSHWLLELAVATIHRGRGDRHFSTGQQLQARWPWSSTDLCSSPAAPK